MTGNLFMWKKVCIFAMHWQGWTGYRKQMFFILFYVLFLYYLLGGGEKEKKRKEKKRNIDECKPHCEEYIPDGLR